MGRQIRPDVAFGQGQPGKFPHGDTACLSVNALITC